MEENKAIIRRAAEAASSGDFDSFDELMVPDLAQEFKEGIAEIRRAFPDYRGTDEIQIAEVDMVAGRFVFHGTHEGEFMGVAPTGRQVTFRGLSLERVMNLGRKSHRNADSTVSLVPSRSTFPAFLSRF